MWWGWCTFIYHICFVFFLKLMANVTELGKMFNLCGAFSLSTKWRNWIKLFAKFHLFPKVYIFINQRIKIFWEIMELIGVGVIELLEEHPWVYNTEWLPIFVECCSAKLDLQNTVARATHSAWNYFILQIVYCVVLLVVQTPKLLH